MIPDKLCDELLGYELVQGDVNDPGEAITCCLEPLLRQDKGIILEPRFDGRGRVVWDVYAGPEVDWEGYFGPSPMNVKSGTMNTAAKAYESVGITCVVVPKVTKGVKHQVYAKRFFAEESDNGE